MPNHRGDSRRADTVRLLPRDSECSVRPRADEWAGGLDHRLTVLYRLRQVALKLVFEAALPVSFGPHRAATHGKLGPVPKIVA